MRVDPTYRGIVGIDIERFSRSEWTDPVRAQLRARLHQLVDQALAAAGISRARTVRKDTGDGVLLLGDPKRSVARLLDPFATRLAGGLHDDNRRAGLERRLRLRVVVHAGQVLADAHGHTGASLTHTARLLDSEASRALLAGSPQADMALVVSDEVFHDVVRNGYAEPGPDAWRSVRIHAKETITRAWAHVPGVAASDAVPAILAAPAFGPASLSVPRELPPPPVAFTGREAEVAILRRRLRPTGSEVVTISAIEGMGGIGKSALGLEVANQLASEFPDGQLYVNLQGSTPGVQPMEPLEALGRMLRSLGLEPSAIPDDVQEAAARLRSLAADRRLLVLLDNAADTAQVGPLLPASPGCSVLITSRRALVALDGVHSLHLGALTTEEAIELLTKFVGAARVNEEAQAAREIVWLCDRLPMAVRIASARLAARPAWSLGHLVNRLADASKRLQELEVGDLALRASFNVSLDALSASSDPAHRQAAQAFGLLALPDGPDFSIPAAAALLDQDERTTDRLLEVLVDAELLATPRPARYRFHDLVRLFARDHADRSVKELDRTAALIRVFSYDTAVVWRTLELLRPGDHRLATVDPRLTTLAPPFLDSAAALDWLELERTNLLAAIGQAVRLTPTIPGELPAQLAYALFGFFDIRNYWRDGLAANQAVLGFLFRSLRDRWGEAKSLANLGAALAHQRRYEEALDYLRESLALDDGLRDRRGRAIGLANLGLVHGARQEYRLALTALRESLGLFREFGDLHGEANVLNSLAVVEEQLGRTKRAIDRQRSSLQRYRELGDRLGQAEALRDLGRVLLADGQRRGARAVWQEALTLYETLRVPEAERVRQLLAKLESTGLSDD